MQHHHLFIYLFTYFYQSCKTAHVLLCSACSTSQPLRHRQIERTPPKRRPLCPPWMIYATAVQSRSRPVNPCMHYACNHTSADENSCINMQRSRCWHWAERGRGTCPAPLLNARAPGLFKGATHDDGVWHHLSLSVTLEEEQAAGSSLPLYFTWLRCQTWEWEEEEEQEERKKRLHSAVLLYRRNYGLVLLYAGKGWGVGQGIVSECVKLLPQRREWEETKV